MLLSCRRLRGKSDSGSINASVVEHVQVEDSNAYGTQNHLGLVRRGSITRNGLHYITISPT